MAEQWTDRSRKALGRADAIARQRGARAIDTHHLLLALVEPGSGLAAELLAEMGVDPQAVVRLIDRVDPAREPAPAVGRLMLTKQLEAALDMASRAAEGLGHEAAGTEHLLQGLLDQPAGAAAAVLGALGVRAENLIRALVMRILQGLEGRLDGAERASRQARVDRRLDGR